MFLTPEELRQASGRTRADAQLRWAIDRGFVADERMTDADGRPLVLRALFDPAGAQSRKVEPDFGAARGT